MNLNNLFSLKNKVALIFGGNGYLGKQFSYALLEYGAKLYCCDIEFDNSKEIQTLKKEFSNRFEMVKVDATNITELDNLKKTILNNENSIDILVNSTTMKGKDFYCPFENTSLEDWNIGILGNLTIPFLTIRTFITIMQKQQKGSVINIASHYGLVGNDQRIYIGANLNSVYGEGKKVYDREYSSGVYNAAKGGLINFTRYLAAYYGEYNVRINTISPGGVFKKEENETFLKKYSKKVPLGRKANPNEINGSLIFLASDASSYVTGHNLIVDGGYTIW